MNRPEQMGKISEQSIKKLVGSLRPLDSAMKYGLSGQSTMSSLKKQRRRRLSAAVLQQWIKKSRKTSRP